MRPGATQPHPPAPPLPLFPFPSSPSSLFPSFPSSPSSPLPPPSAHPHLLSLCQAAQGYPRTAELVLAPEQGTPPVYLKICRGQKPLQQPEARESQPRVYQGMCREQRQKQKPLQRQQE